jgi:hypothetical protein
VPSTKEEAGRVSTEVASTVVTPLRLPAVMAVPASEVGTLPASFVGTLPEREGKRRGRGEQPSNGDTGGYCDSL